MGGWVRGWVGLGRRAHTCDRSNCMHVGEVGSSVQVGMLPAVRSWAGACGCGERRREPGGFVQGGIRKSSGKQAVRQHLGRSCGALAGVRPSQYLHWSGAGPGAESCCAATCLSQLQMRRTSSHSGTRGHTSRSRRRPPWRQR